MHIRCRSSARRTWRVAPIGGGSTSSISKNNTYFTSLFFDAADRVEANAQQVMTVAGSVSNFQVRLTVAPGGTTSWTFTLRNNGADTAVTCTITGTDTSGPDTTHSVSFAEGDLISVSCNAAGNANSTAMHRTAKLVP